MKITSRILAAVLLLGFIIALTTPVRAQTYANQTVGVPTVTVGPTALLYSTNLLIDVRKQQNVTFAMTIGSTLNTNNYYFWKSVDGIKFDTNAIIQLYCTTTGGTRTHLTNVNVQGVGFLKFAELRATDTNAPCTNALSYGIKIQAP